VVFDCSVDEPCQKRVSSSYTFHRLVYPKGSYPIDSAESLALAMKADPIECAVMKRMYSRLSNIKFDLAQN
jgi:hypothetical protein